MNIIKPNSIGQSAQESLENSSIQPIAYPTGLYTVIGSFWLLANSCTLYQDATLQNALCAWSDGTAPQWRLFALSDGASTTIEMNTSGFIASANVVVESSALYLYNTPAWLRTLRFSTYSFDTDENSILKPDSIRNGVGSHWYDNIAAPAPFSGTTYANPMDTEMDIVEWYPQPNSIVSGTPTGNWSSWASTVQAQLGQYVIMPLPAFAGSFSFSIGAPGPCSSLWMGIGSGPVATGLTDIFNVTSATASGINHLFGIGPFNDPNTGATPNGIGVAIRAPNLPVSSSSPAFAWILASVAQAATPIGSDPTSYGGAWGTLIINYNYGKLLMRRNNQLLRGSADRST